MMRLSQLQEPELEFGAGSAGRHIDIRFGLMNYGPATHSVDSAPKTIKVGFVGTQKSIATVKQWMVDMSEGVAQKESRYPNFRPAFPGFNKETNYEAEWITEERFEHAVTAGELADVLEITSGDAAIVRAVDLFAEKIKALSESAKVDVIVCAPPIELFRHLEPEAPRDPVSSIDAESTDEGADHLKLDFHDMLKARTLVLAQPIQFIRPVTYDASVKETTKLGRTRALQDPATRAWNFFTALYYKAGGTPWRLCREATDLDTCYIGVSFYRSLDRQQVRSSVAQVFNERGEGMILRGADADYCEEDKQHHLSKENMKALLMDALKHYGVEHRNQPARVVLHKTSGYNEAELAGCRAALKEYRVHSCDLTVIRKSTIRLFRDGQFPPLRGTFVALDDRYSLLYTRGTIDFYKMYPGQYVPRALEIEATQTDSPSVKIAEEILALTKMNWNNTQFDSLDPITVRAARQVGDILKYVDPKTPITTKYSYFM